MSKFDELREKNTHGILKIDNSNNNIKKIAKESYRVSEVAHNAEFIIKNIDKEFSKKTKLNNLDIKFLFFATALQCARQYIFANDKFKLAKSSDGDKLIKDPLKKITPKDWHEILFGSVPYDAVKSGGIFKEEEFNTGISGVNHRYKALGHDPILGWIIGPINILSSSITKNNFATYEVVDMKICNKYTGGFPGAISIANQQIAADKLNLPAAVLKQAIHFGADYFTKQGLPIPCISIANEKLTYKMLNKYEVSTYTITRGITLSVMINAIIECIHALFYDEENDGDINLYKVRTKKILMYSNVIASTSNIIYVAISRDLKKLDVGGMMVTIYRLISDSKFINDIKYEFIMNEFEKLVQGEEYDF